MASNLVTVRELNQNTSAVLVRVQAGEELVITSNGDPIARLVPLTPDQFFLDRIVGQGRAVAPTEVVPFAMPPWTGEPELNLADELAAEREDEECW